MFRPREERRATFTNPSTYPPAYLFSNLSRSAILKKVSCHTLIMQNEYPNARRPFVLCHTINLHCSPARPNSTNKKPITNERLMCNLTSHQGRGKLSGSAPSADTVSDTTKRLEVVPARELVVFRGGRDVRADDADGEVWDFGDGDFGAVELRYFLVS
jgi:hypothetical protein